MKYLAIALGICLGWAVSQTIYTAGREATRRDCPPMQHGERLLYSEQRTGATICTYSSGWNSYGRGVKRRKL